MDKLFIHGLMVDALIGVYPEERNKKQPMCIDVELAVDIKKAAQTDNVDDAVCYETLVNAITAFVEKSQYFLIEALAENLIQHLFEKFPTPWIKLSICKPGIMPGVKVVGLVIEREASMLAHT